MNTPDTNISRAALPMAYDDLHRLDRESYGRLLPSPSTALAVTLAVAIMMPGVSFGNIGGYGVQPALPAAVLLFALFVLPNASTVLAPGFLIWLFFYELSLAASTLFSEVGSKAIVYFLYQSVSTALYVTSLYCIYISASMCRTFLSAFVSFSVVSALLAALQAVYSELTGHYITLNNNEMFTLSMQAGRGVAFTPEASILVTYLLVSFALVFEGIFNKNEFLPAPLRSKTALGILMLGILATRSSSLVILPLLLMLTLVSRNGWRHAFRTAIKATIIIGPAALVYFFLYLARLDSSDADYSAIIRMAKLYAGMSLFAENPIFGAGLGAGSDAATMNAHRPEWSLNTGFDDSSFAGIDSWLVRTLCEQGLFGGLAILVPFVVFSRLRAASADDHTRCLWLVGMFGLPGFLLTNGYRDLPLMFGEFAAALALARLLRRG